MRRAPHQRRRSGNRRARRARELLPRPPHAHRQRLAELRVTSKQLHARRDELAAALDAEPAAPNAATLAKIADHITEIIDSGTDQTRKALVETLIAEIKITSPSTIIPRYRIPQPHAHDTTADTNKTLTSDNTPARASKEGVRAMTNLVELRGIEPLTSALQERRSTN
jgi:site-specific DNA recombinase